MPVGSRYCPGCGTPTLTGRTSAVTSVETMAIPASRSSISSAIADFDEGRFLPGTLLADRYRIVGSLGKGGMGEVYRATDLRLAQTVALKFLPEAAAHDPALLARFYNEVRIARQITHPNVCRVFDIGEMDGQPFISMQFVDGENLASLLMRIGRLPVDKGVEIVRRLCAGLAAAHSQGVLHRDLKPANIMIDGRGQVLITDFGLAGLAEEIRGGEIRSGTPAYMSPEQLAGTEVTVRSDLYALGLVMYEIFSGKRAWEADSLADLIRLRQESRPADLAGIARDIDPAIQRIVQRCLDPVPSNRPASALAVSAALPGGDPLAAALAAGETPSPEMVAAAGTQENMRPAWAIACLSAIFVILAVVVVLYPWQMLPGTVDFQMPPEALAVQARKLIQQFGYAAPPADSASGFVYNWQYVGFVGSQPRNKRKPWPEIANSQPPLIRFWYRQSPALLEPQSTADSGRIQPDDPAQDHSGMTSLTLDPYGRLLDFSTVPPQRDTSAQATGTPNAAPLFSAAGLDLTRFKPATPQWTPLAAVDSRAAWTGIFPNRPENPIRVEAAWWRGKPVYFDIRGPWSHAELMDTADNWTNVNNYFWVVLEVALLIVGSLLAWRNLRLGRGDRQGAIRIAAVGFALRLAVWALRVHLIPSPWMAHAFTIAVGQALLSGFEFWLVYVALEPEVRRRWPHALITWTRLLSGKWSDPLVGRDVLAGVLIGLGYNLVFALLNVLDMRFGGVPAASIELDSLLGFGPVASGILDHVVRSLWGALGFLLVFFVLRVILRNNWVAAFVFSLAFSARHFPDSVVGGLVSMAIYGGLVVTLLLFGLMPLVVAIFMTDLLIAYLFTTHLTAWYGTSSLTVIVLVAAISVYAFRRAIGPHRLLGSLLEQ